MKKNFNEQHEQTQLARKRMVTKKEITITFHGHTVTVPKGTRITHKTALGYDQRYHFVNDLSFLDRHSMAHHDATYYGIDMPPENVLVLPNKDCQVKFKVLECADPRKTGSTLEIGNTYTGTYHHQNNSIWWTDPGNGDHWVFWINDTAEVIEFITD